MTKQEKLFVLSRLDKVNTYLKTKNATKEIKDLKEVFIVLFKKEIKQIVKTEKEDKDDNA